MVEIKLSDEMLEQIDAMSGLSAPENTSSVQLDFDGAGTMHIIRRDADGKTLQDNAIQNGTSKVVIEDDTEDFNAAKKWRQEQSKIMKFYLIAGLVAIVAIRVVIAMM